MYKVGIKSNGIIIALKEISYEQIKSKSEGVFLRTMIDFYRENFGLNIGKYALDEYESSKEDFFIHIRNEDLEKLREEKLIKLGIMEQRPQDPNETPILISENLYNDKD